MLARRRSGIDRRDSADHLCLEEIECAVRENITNRSLSSELGDFAGTASRSFQGVATAEKKNAIKLTMHVNVNINL